MRCLCRSVSYISFQAIPPPHTSPACKDRVFSGCSRSVPYSQDEKAHPSFDNPLVSFNLCESTKFRPTTTMLYYGLTMKADLNGGSLYISYILSTLIELPGIVFIYTLINVLGRRLLLTISLLFCAGFLLANWALAPYGKHTCFGFKRVYSLQHSSAFTASYQQGWLKSSCSSDVYPSTGNDANFAEDDSRRLRKCYWKNWGYYGLVYYLLDGE